MTMAFTRSALLGTAALALSLFHAVPSQAAADSECLVAELCETDGGDAETRIVEVPVNTETADGPADPVEKGDGFSISVDGEVVAGSSTLADSQRATDVALEQADIQVKFDGLDVRPMLNVSTVPASGTYKAGETLEFVLTLNYGAWIDRADIIITAHDGLQSGEIARVPVGSDAHATWLVPEGMTSKLSYIVRVYDQEGRYDETQALPLVAYDEFETGQGGQDGIVPGATTPGLNQDRTALRNIPVQGGAVTVFGRGLAKGSKVLALNEAAQVDDEGNFIIQRILPPGDHSVEVEVNDDSHGRLDFTRSINIPTDDWYYVGLADFTLGKRFPSKEIKSTYPDEYGGVYNKGRLAFYLKGKIKGSTLLTASLDTGEDNVRNLLRNIDQKDPRAFLKRIDPDDYYPVYGDDSASIEDAPTKGRFYVRVQRDDSHVMWGNFKSYVSGNKFLANERALYGAQGVYKSTSVAPDGGRRTEASVHAAEPGTISQTDILRGTGGSPYFTKFQDITQGTETVSIETRDPVTGIVLNKTTLKSGTDYDIDYSQGVVILKTPLSSKEAGKHLYLVVNYEYTPATIDVKGFAYGGRGQQWLGDNVRVGVSAMRDYSGDSNLQMGGGDVRVYGSEKTWIDFHAAHSRGKGFGFSQSTDGGLTLPDSTPTLGNKAGANAFGFEGKADLGEITGGRYRGDLQGQYAYREKGFTSLHEQVTEKRQVARIAANVIITDKTDLTLEGTQSVSPDKTDRELRAVVGHELTDRTRFEFGVKNTVKSGTAPAQVGHRTELVAKLIHQVDDNTSAYVFGQGTVHRTGTRKRDDRVGVGGSSQLSEKVGIEGEASIGTEGPGAAAKLTYAPNADAKYYFGYELDPYRDLDTASITSGADNGKFVAGGRQRVSEKLSFLAEDSYDMFGVKRTLAQTYGVEYTPFENWLLGAQFELGHITDDTINTATGVKYSDFDRQAYSASIGYRDGEDIIARLKGEMRFEDSEDNTRDMDSYLLQGTMSYRVQEDWRFIANLDVVYSDATATARNGEYAEASIGYAYRPVENDRLNALFKYTYLYDLPGADQKTVGGSTSGPYQRSHIVSADFIYDLSEFVSVGAKYGVRFGESRNRLGGSWEDATAHLAVLRADVEVIRNWDAMVESRVLWSPQADSAQYGALAAVYRHLGDNFKMGIGYNFGRFSEDLRDLVADDHGVFINAVGKF